MWGKQPSVRYSGTKNKDFIIQGKTQDINFGKAKRQYECTEVLLLSRKKNHDAPKGPQRKEVRSMF